MDEVTPHTVPVEVGLKPSLFKAPFYILKQSFANKFLIRNLVRRELRGRYRNSVLGYTWTFIEPALLAVVYYFLFYHACRQSRRVVCSLGLDWYHNLGMFREVSPRPQLRH